MKKTLTVLMMVLMAAMLFVSCDNNTKEPEKKAEAKTYTVTFSTGEGGSDIASQSIEDGKTATKPADPTRTGYYFVRWSATENGTTAFDFSTKIAKDTTIYAVWAKEYKVGDEGPAGGIIFYVNPNAEKDGWTYLEAALADLPGQHIWGPEGVYSTETGIGKGKSNTDKLLAASGDFPAAEACDAYSNGGYDDWFLPSKDELGLMYTNLTKAGKVGTWQSTSSYWTSSESDSSNAWKQNFYDGPYNSYRSYKVNVRPIRAF